MMDNLEVISEYLKTNDDANKEFGELISSNNGSLTFAQLKDFADKHNLELGDLSDVDMDEAELSDTDLEQVTGGGQFKICLGAFNIVIHF